MVIPDELYRKIRQVMPIPCVDLLVTDLQGRILLVRRKNEPAAGQWWFPGGRVHYLETREKAALRKLREECGIEALGVEAMGTFDVILESSTSAWRSHGITTLFHVRIGGPRAVRLDEQSADADWRVPEEWLRENLHGFVRDRLNLLAGG